MYLIFNQWQFTHDFRDFVSHLKNHHYSHVYRWSSILHSSIKIYLINICVNFRKNNNTMRLCYGLNIYEFNVDYEMGFRAHSRYPGGERYFMWSPLKNAIISIIRVGNRSKAEIEKTVFFVWIWCYRRFLWFCVINSNWIKFENGADLFKCYGISKRSSAKMPTTAQLNKFNWFKVGQQITPSWKTSLHTSELR